MPRLMSLPSRERGLKSRLPGLSHLYALSLPSRERGLKSLTVPLTDGPSRSLPSRERGLKSFATAISFRCAKRRAPRGSVD